jgi:hypothetical protein
MGIPSECPMPCSRRHIVKTDRVRKSCLPLISSSALETSHMILEKKVINKGGQPLRKPDTLQLEMTSLRPPLFERQKERTPNCDKFEADAEKASRGFTRAVHIRWKTFCHHKSTTATSPY